MRSAYLMSLRKKILPSIIVFVLALVVISCYLVFQNVGSVHQKFSPKVTAIVDSADITEVWERISFNGKDDLTYNSIFWKRIIVNDASSESDVLLRVKDVNGNVVVDEFQVSPGKSVKLDSLKNNEKYFFEIKDAQGKVFINGV